MASLSLLAAFPVVREFTSADDGREAAAVLLLAPARGTAPLLDDQGFQKVQKKRKKALNNVIDLPQPLTPPAPTMTTQALPKFKATSQEHQTSYAAVLALEKKYPKAQLQARPNLKRGIHYYPEGPTVGRPPEERSSMPPFGPCCFSRCKVKNRDGTEEETQKVEATFLEAKFQTSSALGSSETTRPKLLSPTSQVFQVPEVWASQEGVHGPSMVCGICSQKHETDVCLNKFKAKGHTVARCPNCHQSHHAGSRGARQTGKSWRMKGISPPPARLEKRQTSPSRRPPFEPRIDPRTNRPPPPQALQPSPAEHPKPRHYIPNPSTFPSLQPPIPKPLPTLPTPKVIPSTLSQSPNPSGYSPAFAPPTTSTPARIEAGTQTENQNNQWKICRSRQLQKLPLCMPKLEHKQRSSQLSKTWKSRPANRNSDQSPLEVNSGS
ncbi:protein piccolo-like [Macrobrachium nipponense]|uniref:protein piccolo-like n=1 Tax=Macrobrachium nipponense TaxID=159736 RepID=UPI0030C80BE0